MPYADPEKKRACARAYYAANPEKKRAKDRAYHAANPEKYRARKRAYRAANPEKVRASRQKDILRMYGLSVNEYEGLKSAQCGVCAICFCPPNKKALHIDHDHTTGKIRGLLCSNCNTAIGLLKNSPDRAESAAKYLRSKVA